MDELQRCSAWSLVRSACMINLCLHLEDLTSKLQSWCHFCKHARCLYSPPLLQIAMPIMGQPCQLLWFEETQNGILGNQPNNKLFCRDTVNVSISEITFGLASLTWVQCHSFKLHLQHATNFTSLSTGTAEGSCQSSDPTKRTLMVLLSERMTVLKQSICNWFPGQQNIGPILLNSILC